MPRVRSSAFGAAPCLLSDALNVALKTRPRLASFCGDCGTMLSSSAPSTATAEAQEASSGEAPNGERRQLTVLFCDLVASTALSERLDPEEYRDLIRGYDEAASEVIVRFGGYVAQYQGDGIIAYFEWPTAYGDDAERAVRAGLSLPEVVEKTNRGAPVERHIAVRVGIHTGPVVVGLRNRVDSAESQSAAAP
jgi:class 3 adenylate cyclase